MAFTPPRVLQPEDLTPSWVKDYLSRWGYPGLNKMQAQAVSTGFLDEPNVLLCAPTASGKTLLALLRITHNFTEHKGKAIYIVPLKALAREKCEEFKVALAGLGMTVALAVGDMDSPDEELATADLVVCTSEKMDSLLRHKSSWIDRITLAVIDEAHLLADGNRGATLEVVATKLKQAGCRLVVMSATVPNASELAGWLNARLFTSTWRPTALEIGICSDGVLLLEEGVQDVSEKHYVSDLVLKALEENQGTGQAIVFVATRKSTESVAKELAAAIMPKLSPGDLISCRELAEKALRVYRTPTSQCKDLANLIASGVAFHHAGLPDRDRQLIEAGFKKIRCIKCVVATTTLAMGIDFPASWVIIRDLKRFSGDSSNFIPNLEVQQMLGRAGRPRFDKKGTGIICCTRRDVREARERYVFGPLENIYSQLASEPALRMHTLALISGGYCHTLAELNSFLKKTFYAHQYKDIDALEEISGSVLADLIEWDFIREKQGRLLTTPVGKRVCELYLDPLSAHNLIRYISGHRDQSVDPTFALLLQFAELVESRPLPSVSRKEEPALYDELFSRLEGDEIARLENDPECIAKYKHAKVSNAWINEATEEQILESFDMPPGILNARMRVQEWLAYSTAELAYVMNSSEARIIARKLARRLKHGIKEELLDLTRLRGIGRVRARMLFNSGVTNRSDLASADRKTVSRLLGDKVADRIMLDNKFGLSP